MIRLKRQTIEIAIVKRGRVRRRFRQHTNYLEPRKTPWQKRPVLMPVWISPGERCSAKSVVTSSFSTKLSAVEEKIDSLSTRRARRIQRTKTPRQARPSKSLPGAFVRRVCQQVDQFRRFRKLSHVFVHYKGSKKGYKG
jgi:hypothetical protein